jgi:serine/threonine protein kinase/tetratricopeptide (TPR) repeat protein
MTPNAAIASRFELRQRLGAGGMGVVHLAWDRERRMTVALKTLRDAGAFNLAGLKREFRAIASLSHPNLVALYELFAEDGAWFFTMEVVDGVRFDAWCANTPRLDAPDLFVTTRIRMRTDASRAEQEWPTSARMAQPIADLARLRTAAMGLVDGVEALHRAGILHCDLKPSNVLVDGAGRTVVLDLGLVKERPQPRAREAHETSSVEGTPEYVAPEVVLGEPPTEASDWYSVGVMLYQALAGVPPFQGSHYVTTLLSKLDEDAPRLSDRVDGVPASLDALIASLLVRDPRARAGARELRAWLDDDAAAPRALEPLEPPFLGRTDEEAILSAELERVREGRPRNVLVHGPSGIGKSALIRRFADAAEREGRAIVLAGRCYQREQVPFKALDGVVDAMAARLSRLPTATLATLLPDGFDALAQVFPVLSAIEHPASIEPGALIAPGEILTRAAEAARTLLHRWSERAPIVIVIDDLQWSDADSATFLGRMMDPQSRSRVLLLASARSESDAPLLTALRTAGRERLTELELGPLSKEDGITLAQSMLASSGEAGDLVRAAKIAEGAAGIPFFVTELARHASRSHGMDVKSVDDAIAARADALSPESHALLELSALAGRPLSASLLSRAAGLDTDPLPLVRALTAHSLLRTRGGQSDAIEPYHDRIREVIAASVSSERRIVLHAALGRALDGAPDVDPETVAHHLSQGGDSARALVYQLRAAEGASHALAFDRAVVLFTRALELSPGDLAIEMRLAEALVLAGRARDAAPMFLRCADRSSGTERARLERRAAEEWLKCGAVDEGIAVLRRVLRSVDLRYPDNQLEALGRALVRILRIRRLDGSFVRSDSLTTGALERVDAARAAGVGLMMIDPLRGYGFLARFLLDAVQVGEPRRVSVGLSLNAVTLCRGGEGGYPLAMRWLGRARAIGSELDDPYLLGLADACEAGASVTTGRWEVGARLGLSAPSRLRSTGTPATWECTASVSLGRTSLFAMGRLAEFRRHTEQHLRAANDVGDLFAATYAEVHGWVMAAMDDDVQRGREQLDGALSRWSRLGFHAMHFWQLYAELSYDLYEDQPEQARERLMRARGALKKSRILAMQFYDALLSATDAAIELRLLEQKRGPTAKVTAIGARIGKMGRPYTSGLSKMIEGRVALIEGRAAQGRAALLEAHTHFDGCGMALHRAAVASRIGGIDGGASGPAAIEAARAVAMKEGIRRPERWLTMIAG